MSLDLHIAQRKEIVFIENDVADWQTIAAQAGAGREVIVLDAAGDGLQQMAQALAGRTGIDALHVITHGAEGKLDLGALTLDSTTAAARGGLLAAIGASLAPHGDILLYGCDVGAGQGASFVDRLAIATGADVAASTNPTGAAGLGGDWNLEIAHGSIETAPVVDAALAAQYRQILAITAPTTITFTGAAYLAGTRASDDLVYTLPSQPGYRLVVDGTAEGVGSFGGGYISLSQTSTETAVTVSFLLGQEFTPTSIDLAPEIGTYGQRLTLTGKDTHGATVASTHIDVPSGASVPVWQTSALSGFNDIAQLVITSTSGQIAAVHVDNLKLASVHAPAPTVAGVQTNTANGAYTVGTTIAITIEFDAPVTVDTTGGTPTLKMETGTVDQVATYAGTSGNNGLVFHYVVQPGDTSADLDYFGTGALALNGAIVKDASTGLAAETILPAPGSLVSLSGPRAIVIDTTAPNAPSTPVLAPGSDTGTSSSDHVTTDATPTFTGTAGGDATAVTLYDEHMHVVGSGAVSNGSYAVTPTSPLADGNYAITAVATDAAGNASAPSAGIAVTIDTSAPTVTITSGAASTLKAGDTATVTFTFSEDPGTTFTWSGGTGDVVVGGGTLSALSGTGNVRTATFTPAANTDNGTGSVAVPGGAYADAAGNSGTAGTALHIAYDTKAPTLTIASDKPTLAAGETATITFVFSEDPGSTFTAADVAVGGGALSALSGSGTTRTATFTPDAGVASGTANIAVAAVDYADAAGNTGNAASLTFMYHTLAPDAPAQVALSGASDSGWSSTDGITNHTQLAFSGTATPGIAVRLYDGATQIGSGTADGAGNWAITTATLSEGAHTVVAKTVDGYGSASAPAAAVPVVVDTTAPTLTIASDKAALKAGDTATITFTFSEDPGTTFTAADVNVSGGTLSALAGSGAVRTATFTPAADTDNGHATLGVDAGAYADAAGNTGAARTGPALAFDTKVPVAAVAGMALSADAGTSAVDFVTNVAAQTLSGTLDAALGAGERVQVSLDGGTSWADAAATGGGTAWSYAATLATGSHDIRVRVQDAAGNTGPGHTQAYTLDTTAPTLAVASDANPLKAGATATITFTFSEDPGATFTAADVAVSGGTLSALAGSGTVRTAVFTPDANLDNQTASITVAAGSYQDAAGNAGGAGTPVSIYYDTLVPGAPAAPTLDAASHTGAAPADGITNLARPTVEGVADAHAVVMVYDGTSRMVGVTIADGAGAWHVQTDTLADGYHVLYAVQSDAIGNVSPFGAPLVVQVDTQAPPAPSAPLLAAASDSGTPGDRITKVATPTFSGTAIPSAQVTLYDTDGHTALGTAQADADGNWTITTALLADGTHDVTVRQGDAAGNWSAPSQAVALTVDTAAPAAPSAPHLQPQSDTGVRGDGVTYAVPVLAGSAAAGDLVTLYDGTRAVGTAHAGTDGTWTIVAQGLAVGRHTLTATGTDAAGNASAASGAFALTIEDAPVPLVDGVAVVTLPVPLPGGGAGTQVQVPIVGAGRADAGGAPGTADIPLDDVLTAHVAPGYGLTATGGPVTTAADGGAALIAAIRAAAGTDAAPLAGAGQGYLAQLAANQPLLVETIAPVTGTGTPAGPLTLSGTGGAQQHVALVIDATGMAGGTIALQDVDFAAVVGKATVVAQAGTRLLTGDAAAQDFAAQSGSGTQLYAGGGNDVLRFGAPAAAVAHSADGATAAATAPTTTLLHGGSGDDTAVFAGARADFDVETHHGYVVVRSKAAPDAQALVVNVEHLQFADTTVAAQDDAGLAPLAGLYRAVLGRQADIHGLDFWAGVHDRGVGLGAIALAMVGSAERLGAQGGFNGDAGHDVGLLYAGLFDRAPDAGGLAYWTTAMQHGATLAQVADAMLQSVEMVGQQGTPLDWNFSV